MGNGSESAKLVSLARTLLSKSGTLESTGPGEPINRAELVEALKQQAEMNTVSNPLPDSLTASAAAAEALSNAESALTKTAQGASPSNLTDLEFASLEAIVRVTGRPAMYYVNNQVQMPPNDLGENGHWRTLIAVARSRINDASSKVGRISTTANSGLPEYWGTGWCVTGGLLATNRHVVEKLVENTNDPRHMWRLATARRPFIDFAATGNSAAPKRFDITQIVFCAEEPPIDIAFLGVAASPSALPAPLVIDWDSASAGIEIDLGDERPPVFQGQKIYVVGHPYRRLGSALIESIFGTADGTKRWSPGMITRMDGEQPVFDHDCSTLGGNSGSCVLTVGEHKVIGIHTAGVEVDELTGRGSANRAMALSRLTNHRVAEIFQTGRL